MKNKTQVNADLRGKLEKELDLKKSRVYQLIRKVADEYDVPMGYAAIKLASINNINISKWATDDYYQAIQGRKKLQSEVAQPIHIPRVRKVEVSPKAEMDLSKVRNPELREILDRDVNELNHAISIGYGKMSKTCMVLSGSIAEALLLERLTRNIKITNQSIAVAKSIKEYKPHNPNQPNTWGLATLVEVAQNIPNPLLPTDSLPQIGQLRSWRNLIHPGRELNESTRNRIKPTKPRARNAVGFLQFISSEII